MALTLEKKTQGSATVITCRGAVIYGTESDQLREYVKEALGSAPMVVLDLANVTYVDSGGLGAIVGLYSSARAAGGRSSGTNRRRSARSRPRGRRGRPAPRSLPG